jgi:hypothetical protein
VTAFRQAIAISPFLSHHRRVATLRIATEVLAVPPKKGEPSSSSNSNSNSNNKNSRRRKNGLPAPGEDEEAAAQNTTDPPALPQQQQQQQASLDVLQRITQLEELVARQTVEMKRLKDQCQSLTQAVDTFAAVVELLREAGLQTAIDDDTEAAVTKPMLENASIELLEDNDEIFGKAPSSVLDAADAAGAAVLAGLLAGQRRMLVDVRDVELSTGDPDTLVQFIELAILPVAAGLEGLKSKRNRVKIVFPKVSQLLEYRKTMALAAPEVVTLSTLALDPIEVNDNLVVIIAPHPADTEAYEAMNNLLAPFSEAGSRPSRDPITQPVVVLNPYMSPVQGPAATYEVAYHLRLLTVQYIASPPNSRTVKGEDDSDEQEEKLDDEAALEAAMKHAKEVSRGSAEHRGTTRAMVIRAYPKPWNIFVDTSPDTDADFEVAATFEEAPTLDDINTAIIECLEGSEQEDEIVAQQMQQALESGQLDRVSELLGDLGLDIFDDEDDEDEDGDDDDDLWRLHDVDTV